MKNKIGAWLAVFFLFLSPGVFAQAESDPALLVGITLTELYNNYGVPRNVYAVRGIDTWQDDVVFVYDRIEFFVFGNRVWQVKVSSAYTVKDGDTQAVVTRAMGEGRNFEGYTLYQLPGRSWPLMMRVNWNSRGRAEGIYIYRPDF